MTDDYLLKILPALAAVPALLGGAAAGTATAATTAATQGGLKEAAKKIVNPRQQTKGQFAAQMAQGQANADSNRKLQEHEAQANRSSEMAEKAKANADVQKAASQEVSAYLNDIRILKYYMGMKQIRDEINMLKGQLQLPGQLAETLQDDIRALDPNHEIVETEEGTSVNNLNPFMEDIVGRLHDLHVEEQPVEEPRFTPATLFY